MVKFISIAEVDGLLSQDAEWALFDVREAGEAERGHILGATFLPRRMLELKLQSLVPRKGTTIVVYDEGGRRAALAAARMQQFGYSGVRVMEGGVAAWRKSGRPLSTGSNVPSKRFGELVSEQDRSPSINADTLEAWRKEGRKVVLCDIRTPEEYKGPHLPGAISTPGFDAALCVEDLRAKHAAIVVHCAGRTRSIIACETLRHLGLPEVYALENGTMGWVLSDRKLETVPGAGTLIGSAESRRAAHARASELAQGASVGHIDSDELAELLERRGRGEINLYVFDARQVPEYEAGHVPGSAALPGALAVQRTDEFIAVRSGQVVFIDDDETRALIAGYWLRRMGLPSVRILKSGIASWAAERELVKGRDRAEPLGLTAARAKARKLTAIELKELCGIDPAPVVLDVDTSAVYAAGHVPGAQWLPRGWLELRVDQVAPNRRASIVVTCRNGLQSSFAAVTLAELGYADVRTLAGGTQALSPADLERGPPKNAAADDVIVPPYAKGRDAMKEYLEWEVKLTHR